MKYKNEFIGEMLGTFILVLFGCGSIAVSILFEANQGLMQIALAWGIGLTLAIYITRHISCAHLNPAVSIAMVISKRMLSQKLPAYIFGQFIGAFLAGLTLYLLFSPSILAYENTHSIVRGTAESIQTAKIFAAYYANAGGSAVVSLPLAMGAEAFGIFLLLIMIFALTEGCNIGRPDNALTPLFIGLSLTSIICLLGPLTQAALNPARDLAPRLISWIFGWDKAVFPDQVGGFFLVYILSPIIGGSIASLFFIRILEPAMKNSSNQCNCSDDNLYK